MAANAAAYAVVDKSKKKKRPPIEKKLLEDYLASNTTHMYDVVTTDVDNLPVYENYEGEYSMVTQDNHCEAVYSKYSMVNQDTVRVKGTDMHHEAQLVETNPGKIASKVQKETPNKWCSHSALACIFPTIVAAIAILICIISIAYFSTEIDKLKTQTASPFGQRGEVNSPFSQQPTINTSIDVINSILDNRTNQLIDQFHKHLNSATENSTQQLSNKLESQLNNTETKYQQLLQNITELEYRTSVITSCAALHDIFPTPSSGYYWVVTSDHSVLPVYCDMTRSCGGVTGGWVRVGYLDMTDSSHQCPSGFTEHNDFNIRTCRRTDTLAGCVSVMMDVPYQYSRVCGRVRAYQVGNTNAFLHTGSIDRAYVDGVSLTRGLPSGQHIWTFAAGLLEVPNRFETSTCPCSNAGASQPPAFVGNDYFCETGNHQRTPSEMTFYSADPLWDGAGCGPINNCCSFNNPPWFHKQFPQPTTDPVEMRVCRNENADNEDIAIDIVEIYVQ